MRAAILGVMLLAACSTTVVGTSRAGDETLTLLAEQGHCPAGTQVATLQAGRQVYRGCWTRARGHVLVQWDDGDVGIIAERRVQWR